MQSKERMSRFLHSDRLTPLVLQVFGLISFLSMGIFWAVTDRISAALLAVAGSLVGAGTYVDAVKSLPDVAPNDKS